MMSETPVPTHRRLPPEGSARHCWMTAISRIRPIAVAKQLKADRIGYV